jgi:hypothetical protein
MFMVPAYEDLPDGSRKRLAHVPRIEHKLGHHASVTAQVVFEESPGVLIGERGEERGGDRLGWGEATGRRHAGGGALGGLGDGGRAGGGDDPAASRGLSGN